MNKTEFIDAIVAKTDLKKKDVDAAFKAGTEVIAEQLKKGEKVTFPGFASFEAKKRAAREGRNPQSGEKMTIPASTVARCKMSPSLLK